MKESDWMKRAEREDGETKEEADDVVTIRGAGRVSLEGNVCFVQTCGCLQEI